MWVYILIILRVFQIPFWNYKVHLKSSKTEKSEFSQVRDLIFKIDENPPS